MVCPRCITRVKDILSELDISYVEIKLGEIVLDEIISEEVKIRLADTLKKDGFELLEDAKSKVINRIKTIIISSIHHSENIPDVNFSSLLSEQLHQEYSGLSKLFSTVEGITIEKYIVKQKIEKVKELLYYGEHTLSEIAVRLNYNSVSYLSAQFKKETGMTISAFKKLKTSSRKPIDKL